MFAFGFVILAAVGFALSKTGVLGGFTGGDGELSLRGLGVDAGELRVRVCSNTESLCRGDKNCRGVNGQVSAASAIQEDGNKCCLFGCEDDTLAVRSCSASETMCDVRQACKMGNNVQMPVAVTPGGRSCCQFGCDTGDTVERACFSSETVCPSGSLCLNFSGNATAPRAHSSDGRVCCQHNGGAAGDTCVSV